MAVFDCTKIWLEKGSTGDKVSTLQTHLKKLGYYSRQIDKYYGDYTYKGVKAFQTAYNLTVDGKFGPETCKKLNSVIESKNTTTTGVALSFDCPKTSLAENSPDKEGVTKLQTMLNALGYYKAEIDGVFGSKTKTAVKNFQSATGHDPDGWFGPKTCPDLNKKYAEKTGTTTSQSTTKKDTTPFWKKEVIPSLVLLPDVVVLPETEFDSVTMQKKVTEGSTTGDTTFDCPNISLRKGSTGDDVKKLQTILKARGYYTRQIDGNFGKYTKEGVKKLQSAQGNDPDGWFGPKTCAKLQGTSTTSNTATGTQDKKATKYTLKDIISVSTNDDMEGLSHEVTVKTTYSQEKLNHMRKLQKTTFTIKHGTDTVYTHDGYVNEIKITHEDSFFFIELTLVGYTAFLDVQVEYEKTAKKSELLKDLIEMAGLKPDINLAGLSDDEYTIKVQSAGTGDTGGNLVQSDGNDCDGGAGTFGSPKMQTNKLSSYSYNIDECGGNVKIGNSSANYAQDTRNMSGKEAILDARKRFKYGRSMSSSQVYNDNVRCPRDMWTSTGQFWGNCADISRLIKCIGDVHGVKVGIHHMYGHYYNLIEVNGKTYRFDCCFKDGGEYNGEITNNLTMRGGPWSA